MADTNSSTENSNAFLEWMRPFMDNEQVDAELEDQLDMFKSENLTADCELVTNPS